MLLQISLGFIYFTLSCFKLYIYFVLCSEVHSTALCVYSSIYCIHVFLLICFHLLFLGQTVVCKPSAGQSVLEEASLLLLFLRCLQFFSLIQYEDVDLIWHYNIDLCCHEKLWIATVYAKCYVNKTDLTENVMYKCFKIICWWTNFSAHISTVFRSVKLIFLKCIASRAGSFQPGKVWQKKKKTIQGKTAALVCSLIPHHANVHEGDELLSLSVVE